MTDAEKKVAERTLRELNGAVEEAIAAQAAAVVRRDAAVRDAVARGMSQTAVADALGLGRQRVSQILAKATQAAAS